MTNDEYLKELASRGDGSLQAWFDAEHVDNLGQIADMSQKSADCVRNDGKMSETGVSASDVDANDENATCNNSGENVTHATNEQISEPDAQKSDETAENATAKDDIRNFDDSREKLEADVSKWCLSHAYGDTGYTFIIKQLDRQAEITRKTEQAAWIQQANGLIHEANVRADELQDTVESLKAERDYWRTWYLNIEHDNSAMEAKVDDLRYELAKRDNGVARLKRQRDEARQELEKNRWEYCETCEHAEHVDRLEAECDKLKRKEKQLGNELGLRDRAIELLQDVKQELIAERDLLKSYVEDATDDYAKLVKERDALRVENMALKADSDECVPKAIKKRDEVIKILKTERDALAADLQDCERQREHLRQALGMAIDHAHEVVSLVNLDGEVIG